MTSRSNTNKPFTDSSLHSLAQPSCLSSPIYTLQTTCPSQVLPKLTSLSQPAPVQETVAYQQRIFWCISFYGVLTNAAQLCNVNQMNTRMLLAKNLTSHVLSFSCVCYSENFLHKSTLIFYLCPLQLNFPLCVCTSKTPTNTNDFPKNL